MRVSGVLRRRSRATRRCSRRMKGTSDGRAEAMLAAEGEIAGSPGSRGIKMVLRSESIQVVCAGVCSSKV